MTIHNVILLRLTTFLSPFSLPLSLPPSLLECGVFVSVYDCVVYVLSVCASVLMFPSIRTIKATDYVNNSTNLFVEYHRYQRDHSIVWLLNRECMTISSQNYRTCFILASFYRSLGSRDATKLGRVMRHVVRHYIERHAFLFKMQWWDYEVYSRESSSPVISTHCRDNIGDLLIMALFFICILCVALVGCTVLLHL